MSNTFPVLRTLQVLIFAECSLKCHTIILSIHLFALYWRFLLPGHGV